MIQIKFDAEQQCLNLMDVDADVDVDVDESSSSSSFFFFFFLLIVDINTVGETVILLSSTNATNCY